MNDKPKRKTKKQLVDELDQARERIAALEAQEQGEQASKAQLDIIRFLPDPTFAIDREGRVIAWNPAIEELTAVPAGAILGKGNYEYALPFYGERRPILIDLVYVPFEEIERKYAKIHRHGQWIMGEAYTRHPQRGVAYLTATAAALYDAHGNPIGAIEVIRDMTESKQTEETIRESQQRLALLVQHSPLAVIEWNAAFEVVDWNPAAEQIFGYTWEQAIGRHAADLIIPESARDKLDQMWQDLLAQRSGAGIVCDNVTQDRRTVTCEWYNAPLVGAEGNVIGVASLIADVTDRKRADQEIRRAVELQQLILETAPTAMLITRNSDSTVMYANKKLGELFGREVKDVIGEQSINWYYDPADRQIIMEKIREQGHVHNLEVRLKHPNGNTFWILLSVQPIKFGNEHALLSGIIDNTERKQAAAAARLDEIRLQTLLQLSQMTEAAEQDIANFALEGSMQVTQSQIGYLAFMNEDETILTMYAWSKTAMDECKVLDKPIDYPIETTGLWGEAVRQRKPVITNDYAAPSPHKKGYPQGHVRVVRHMNIPVFDGGRIVAVAGVGNKAADYDEQDVRQLTLLMNGMWQIIRRKRVEAERECLQQDIIEAQRHALKELSTPIIPLMDAPDGRGGIIVMPLIGSIDTLRTKDITRALLKGISEHRAQVVILDITGVPIVDSGVANHLNKTIQAARLKGARTIITGISDAVAEAIVDVGIDWANIETASDLQSGLTTALAGLGLGLVSARP